MNSDSPRNLNDESQAQASFLTDVIISQESLEEKQNEKKIFLMQSGTDLFCRKLEA